MASVEICTIFASYEPVQKEGLSFLETDITDLDYEPIRFPSSAVFFLYQNSFADSKETLVGTTILACQQA